MVDIPGLTSAAAAAAPSQSAAATTKLSETFDTFLTLLTTQLQNQDPLDPVDSGQFTEQLVMFTNAEQGIATNSNLEKLVSMMQGSQNASAVNYLGTTVLASNDAAELANGAAEWNYTLGGTAEEITLTVKNANGTEVFRGGGENTVGSHKFNWDGKNTQGTDLPEGFYTLSIDAKDSGGQVVESTTLTDGVVSGIETIGDVIQFSVNGKQIKFDDVLSVKQTALPTTTQSAGDA